MHFTKKFCLALLRNSAKFDTNFTRIVLKKIQQPVLSISEVNYKI